MRRRITAAVLAAAMMLSLGACSGSGRTQDTGGSQAGMENMTFEQMPLSVNRELVSVVQTGFCGNKRTRKILNPDFLFDPQENVRHLRLGKKAK